MRELPRPSVRVELDAQPYWDATAEGRLLLPRCDRCDVVIWYPKGFCSSCGSFEVSWFEASGRGTVYSCTVTRKGMGEYRGIEPYVLAYVELEEGPRVMTNVVGCPPEDVAIGMAVVATFEPTGDGPALLRFQPRTP
jgi:hypothetical protein